jgi:HEAT repeat protein
MVTAKEWLEAVPSADAPWPRADAAPDWDTWVGTGRTIPEIEGELVRILGHDPDAVWRGRAAMALGYVGGDPSVEALIRAMGDAPIVAMEAAASLGRLGRPDAVEPLCQALRSPDVNVRASASTALGNFKNATARECLGKALHDPDLFVQSAAEEAMRRQGR